MSRLHLAAAFALLAAPAFAEVPQVVADIAPVHGLVARVMAGVGEPVLLMRPGASPHHYAMRPSEAAALSGADVVFMVGAELTPWLGRPLESLASGASRVPLLHAAGTTALPVRERALFGGGDDGHGHDHADHDHDHANEGPDPHAWLDPENGKAWLAAIAAELSRLDPENAAAYAANTSAGAEEIDAAADDVRAELATVPGLRFIVFHDAYQYFENRFDFPAAGAIAISDAAPSGPARIAELRDRIAALGIDCALSEPQFDPDLVATVLDGAEARTAVLDPLGTGLATGAEFYPALIRSAGSALASCR
ncbi:zinc ABC transporter substrate-binding protein [Paracoccus sp. Z118]|uniref:zinc ABC transporter substrate-binding protein n=1 Tax=Paracoccus sp. Z118 TaxID=2851017 RepID=UPI001C2C792D|nr:zinc ABC transporter substrate-binding protein [Paracoccus sp. Z118]